VIAKGSEDDDAKGGGDDDGEGGWRRRWRRGVEMMTARWARDSDGDETVGRQ